MTESPFLKFLTAEPTSSTTPEHSLPRIFGNRKPSSIFMSPFNVHVNRAPMTGRVIDVQYTHGKYFRAFADKASLDLARLLFKRQQITGSTLRSRSADEKGAILRGLEHAAWAAFAAGAIAPVIDRVLPISRADEAHAAIASDVTFGKVVLTVSGA